MTNLIAVFCSHQRDLNQLELTPRKIFRRIKNIDDIRGIKFIGIIKMNNWRSGEEEIIKAYEYLLIEQPELFN
jgi:hypothetical protein